MSRVWKRDMKKISIIVLIVFILSNAADGTGTGFDFRSRRTATSKAGWLALRVPLNTKEKGFIERAGKAEEAIGNKQFRQSIIITSLGTFVAVTVASLGLLDIKISYPRMSDDYLSKIVQMNTTPKIPATPITENRLSLIRKEFESSIAALSRDDISVSECITYAHRLKNAARILLDMHEDEAKYFYNSGNIAFLASFIKNPEVVRKSSFIAREIAAVAKQYVLLWMREMIGTGSIIDPDEEDKIRDLLNFIKTVAAGEIGIIKQGQIFKFAHILYLVPLHDIFSEDVVKILGEQLFSQQFVSGQDRLREAPGY